MDVQKIPTSLELSAGEQSLVFARMAMSTVLPLYLLMFSSMLHLLTWMEKSVDRFVSSLEKVLETHQSVNIFDGKWYGVLKKNSIKFLHIQATDNSKHCTLMKEGQCRSYSPCEGSFCLSGKVDCKLGVSTKEETESPCVGEAEFNEEEDAVHWSCTDPLSLTDEHIDVYGNQSLPSGTVCMTVKRLIQYFLKLLTNQYQQVSGI